MYLDSDLLLLSDAHTWHSYWPASRADTYFIWNPSLNINLILPFDPSLQSTSVFRPTFRVQRLSFAFLRETKRSSEMNVSSSTWSQRQQRQRWKRWKYTLYENIRPLTVIMWLSLPRTQDTDLKKKTNYLFVVFRILGVSLISRVSLGSAACEAGGGAALMK